MKIILLFSGGLDSTTLLYFLREGNEVIPLSFDYGQRHRKELDAARLIDPSTQILTFPQLQQTKSEIPDGHYNDETMKVMVYPNRNMVMLSLAVGIAVDRKADAVAYAAHAGDHTIYPDCRPEFHEALHKAILLGNWHQVSLIAPFIRFNKAEIVVVGHKLGVPFEKTWSCYRGGAQHCGTCGTCYERREAFEQGGVPDPTVYTPQVSRLS